MTVFHETLGEQGIPTTKPTGRRSRRLLVAAIVAGLLILTILLVIGIMGRTSVPDNDPEGYGAKGARAVASILEDHGVDVTITRSTAATETALEANPDAAIAVSGGAISVENLERVIEAAPQEIIVVAPEPWMIDVLGLPATATPVPGAATCAREDGPATISVRERRGLFPVGEGTSCAPVPAATLGAAGYAVLGVEQGGHTYTLVATPSLLQNRNLASADNAAVALRTLGASDHLVWFVPGPADLVGATPASGVASLPREYFAALAGVAAVAVMALLCWGRRFGRLVIEPLPVIVPQLETTLGRSRLYQRSRDLSHAASILRSAARLRIRRALHLPQSCEQRELVRAVTARTGIAAATLNDLLYAASVTTDAELVNLAQDLQTLEDRIRP
ncbi:hypothetical protein JT358_14440 [Micrococcales bacterium 31B]|nr:hypothetical protein [Micrococcales bacterium 31B]